MSPDDLKNISDMIPESTKEDLLNPSAKQIGGAGGTILEAANHLFLDGLGRFNYKRRLLDQQFQKELKTEILQIPEEHRDDSKMGLIMKALNESQYRLDDDEIRQGFAKLVRLAANDQTNDKFYPSFIEILSNMSPAEADLLIKINSNWGSQIVTETLIATNKDNSGSLALLARAYIFDNGEVADGSLDVPVELLQRSRLIELIEDGALIHKHYNNQYEEYEKRWKAIPDERIPGLNVQTQKLDFRKGYIKLTAFGESFLRDVLGQKK